MNTYRILQNGFHIGSVRGKRKAVGFITHQIKDNKDQYQWLSLAGDIIATNGNDTFKTERTIE